MDKNKRRDWVKNAIIVFLVVMLILTLFSNTIMNYSLPEVSAQYCSSGAISNKIRGSGVVQTDDPYSVVFKETRTIESVAVRVGDEVSKDDVLYYLEPGESEELKEAIKELEKLEREYETEIITKAVPSKITNAVDNDATGTLAGNQAKIEAAQKNVEYWEEKVEALTKQADALENGTSTFVAEKKAIEDAEAAINLWTEQNDIDSENLTTASTVYETAQKTVSGIEAQLKDAKDKLDVSDNNTALKVKELEKELKKAKKELEKAKTDYNNAKANEQYSSQMVASSKEAKKNAQRAYDDKSYTLSVQKDEAQDSLDEAKEYYEDLLDNFATQYGLEGKKKAIEEQREEVEKLKGTEGGDSIKAPVAGIVLSLAYVSGEEIEKGTEVSTIQKSGKGYTLTMSVTNEQAKYVGVGDEAEVVNSWWYSDIHGRIVQIRADKDNPSTNKLLVFELEGEGIENGQTLSLSVGNRTSNYDVIVPNSAIKEDNKGNFVLKVESKNTPFGNRYIAERVDVTILAKDENQSAISGDLDGWEYIITTSSKPVEDGKQVRLKD